MTYGQNPGVVVTDLAKYPTWRDIEPLITKTYIGFLKRDLRTRWIVRAWFVDSEHEDDDIGWDGWWYLTNDGNWCELFSDPMLVLTHAEAKLIHQEWAQRNPEVVFEMRRISDYEVLGR